MVDFDADLLASEFTRDLRKETKFTYDTVACICLTNGVLLLLIAVFGFLSERSENRWFSDGYTCFTSLLAGLAVVSIVAITILNNEGTYKELHILQRDFPSQYAASREISADTNEYSREFSGYMDRVMTNLECCGINGVRDFYKAALKSRKSASVIAAEVVNQSLLFEEEFHVPPPCCYFIANAAKEIGHSEDSYCVVRSNSTIRDAPCRKSLISMNSALNTKNIVLFTLITFFLICGAVLGKLLHKKRYHLDHMFHRPLSTRRIQRRISI
ncbi:hypothetical protein SprV_0200620200 [Sparganum proliferum]